MTTHDEQTNARPEFSSEAMERSTSPTDPRPRS